MSQNNLTLDQIKSKIFEIRGLKVMFDKDLADFYDVETKQLNRSVKRNMSRFPFPFMFQLSKKEFDLLRCHFGTSIVERGGRQYLPFAFTEQGVAMLAGILKSQQAVQMSIQIINQFISLRKFASNGLFLSSRLELLEKKQIIFENKTSKNFEKIFNAIENNSDLLQQGVFFKGQIFDAHKFAIKLVKSAKKSIILIDNYIEEDTLIILSNRNKAAKLKLITNNLSNNLKLLKKKVRKTIREY